MQYLSNKSTGVGIGVVICVCVELLCATRVKVCDRRCVLRRWKLGVKVCEAFRHYVCPRPSTSRAFTTPQRPQAEPPYRNPEKIKFRPPLGAGRISVVTGVAGAPRKN